MNLPLALSVLIGQAVTGEEAGYEIYLNRSGINSIDLPRGKVSAECGGRLVLKFINRGAPIHITVSSSNAAMYTDFFHENLYVVDASVVTIPIRKESEEGSFDLEIIAGYGVVKTITHIQVLHPSHLRPVVQEEMPLHPVAHGRPHFLMILMGIALILYTSWFYTDIEYLNIASFIILIVGALYTWYRQE
ncbi:hypothetical protein [uncultured Methanoregula sp.]|uniref:DUF7524 family protein n=1 Tax=uncultured Methanoregula sp. TaxID=1005933 RepID=UPI002AAAD7C8|nr:hypothetical protein [uncultured Methanoregula sp.]